MEDFLKVRNIPGGALGVLRTWEESSEDRTYFRGYGSADAEGRIPVTPHSLFRIASISKPITAVAVLALADRGQITLDDRLLDHLDPDPLPSARRKPDPRWEQITIRHLLQHTGGWDRDATFDPMFRSTSIATEAEQPGPADANTIIRYMRSQPLDFDPGTRIAYSNFGYCLLGRLIESVIGSTYESWVRETILLPLGITRMRIGASLPADRAPEEVHYHVAPGSLTTSVFPGDREGERVPAPYGGFHLEAMDAHGGWIASVEDLIRFARFLDRPERFSFLSPDLRQEISRPPEAPVARDDSGKIRASFYGLGWMVRPKSKGANYWHTGSLPGTFSLLVRRWDGFSWVVLFNRRGGSPDHPDSEIDPALHRAAAEVKGWENPPSL